MAAAFSGEPWNENRTREAAREDLSRTMNTPRFLGLVYVEGDEVVAFHAGCGERDQNRSAFYLGVLSVRPDLTSPGEGGTSAVYLITHGGTPARSFHEKDGYAVSREDIVMIRDWG